MSTAEIGQLLSGFTVGITADRRWEEQAALFERRGAVVVHGPSIRTLPLGAEGPLREATETLVAKPPDVVIANTGLGIRSWLGAADSWDLGGALLGALRDARIYARGPKASGAIHSAGLDVVARPRTERLRDTVNFALAELMPGQRVALQVDGSGGTPEIDRLRAAGADVVVVPVYLWKLPEESRPAVRLAEGLVAGRVHAVTFTSGPALANWLAIAAEHGIEAELRGALTGGRVVVGCVGPVCVEAARRAGVFSEQVVQPAAWRLGPLVRAVADRLVLQTVHAAVGTTELLVRGTVVTVDGEAIALSETEARLLAALARRPGAVLTKQQLLRAVWGSEIDDPHTVEVAVGRLRRRLGRHARLVASVHRRGYALRARTRTPSEA